MITEEQISQIKNQLIQQIETTFPESKKDLAKSQIESMNPEQLEEFLKQNNSIRGNDDNQTQNQCIFCSIASGEIESYKIGENENAIAVLEINPISKAHTLIIPKEHISSSEEIPSDIFSLAKKMAKKIKEKFKPKDVIISSSSLFGHEIVNVLPVYENENLGSKRSKANPEKLKETQELLTLTQKEHKEKKISKKDIEKINGNEIWLPKRIP